MPKAMMITPREGGASGEVERPPTVIERHDLIGQEEPSDEAGNEKAAPESL